MEAFTRRFKGLMRCIAILTISIYLVPSTVYAQLPDAGSPDDQTVVTVKELEGPESLQALDRTGEQADVSEELLMVSLDATDPMVGVYMQQMLEATPSILGTLPEGYERFMHIDDITAQDGAETVTGLDGKIIAVFIGSEIYYYRYFKDGTVRVSSLDGFGRKYNAGGYLVEVSKGKYANGNWIREGSGYVFVRDTETNEITEILGFEVAGYEVTAADELQLIEVALQSQRTAYANAVETGIVREHCIIGQVLQAEDGNLFITTIWKGGPRVRRFAINYQVVGDDTALRECINNVVIVKGDIDVEFGSQDGTIEVSQVVKALTFLRQAFNASVYGSGLSDPELPNKITQARVAFAKVKELEAIETALNSEKDAYLAAAQTGTLSPYCVIGFLQQAADGSLSITTIWRGTPRMRQFSVTYQVTGDTTALQDLVGKIVIVQGDVALDLASRQGTIEIARVVKTLLFGRQVINTVVYGTQLSNPNLPNEISRARAAYFASLQLPTRFQGEGMLSKVSEVVVTGEMQLTSYPQYDLVDVTEDKGIATIYGGDGYEGTLDKIIGTTIAVEGTYVDKEGRRVVAVDTVNGINIKFLKQAIEYMENLFGTGAHIKLVDYGVGENGTRWFDFDIYGPILRIILNVTTGEITMPVLDEAIQLSKENLAALLEVDVAEIQLTSADGACWTSSALGYPEPGQVYLTVMTTGFKIILSYDGADFEYHTNTKGLVKLDPDVRETIEGKKDIVRRAKDDLAALLGVSVADIRFVSLTDEGNAFNGDRLWPDPHDDGPKPDVAYINACTIILMADDTIYEYRHGSGQLQLKPETKAEVVAKKELLRMFSGIDPATVEVKDISLLVLNYKDDAMYNYSIIDITLVCNGSEYKIAVDRNGEVVSRARRAEAKTRVFLATDVLGVPLEDITIISSEFIPNMTDHGDLGLSREGVEEIVVTLRHNLATAEQDGIIYQVKASRPVIPFSDWGSFMQGVYIKEKEMTLTLTDDSISISWKNPGFYIAEYIARESYTIDKKSKIITHIIANGIAVVGPDDPMYAATLNAMIAAIVEYQSLNPDDPNAQLALDYLSSLKTFEVKVREYLAGELDVSVSDVAFLNSVGMTFYRLLGSETRVAILTYNDLEYFVKCTRPVIPNPVWSFLKLNANDPLAGAAKAKLHLMDTLGIGNHGLSYRGYEADGDGYIVAFVERGVYEEPIAGVPSLGGEKVWKVRISYDTVTGSWIINVIPRTFEGEGVLRKVPDAPSYMQTPLYELLDDQDNVVATLANTSP
jgi:hypothetical protein